MDGGGTEPRARGGSDAHALGELKHGAQACGVHDDIFAIVFGESVLNDAVAIVLIFFLVYFASMKAYAPTYGPEKAGDLDGDWRAHAALVYMVFLGLVVASSIAMGSWDD